ncbi:hypothetical protein H9P43_003267 [Blastocladiella emersonii ATCC 22665]|nr:hypothetical protein H9P43_003267 [Blastocladiella emersonii ATCC 22665]
MASLSYDQLMPRVTQELHAIQRNVDTVQSRLRLLGTPRDTAPLRTKLHKLQEDTMAQLQKTAEDIDRLNTAAEATSAPQNKVAAQRIATEFSALMIKFQAAQKEYAQRSQADIASARQALQDEEDRMERDDVPLLGGPSSQGAAAQAQLQQVHDVEVAYNETLIAEREAEIREIEQGVHMVNDIFRKIGSLVKDQGHLFDNIEANLGSAQINVENANHELSTANKRSRSCRECKCWVLVVLIGLVALFGLIIVLT